MKKIYLIRHSGPFVKIHDYENVNWSEFNKNMILSSEGERKAKKLCDIEELKNLDVIYSSNSFRAISTAKYIAEVNNLEIHIDNRINEREFGIEYIKDLPENFVVNQFKDETLKYGDGESLQDVNSRFNKFIEEILNSDYNNIALFIHGVVLMSYLKEKTNFDFDGKKFKVMFQDKEIINDKMSNPDIYKIEFDDSNNILNIERIIMSE